MASSTVEDYLKRIYLEQATSRDRLVSMGRLAKRMAVAPGTATAMVKALAESRLLDYEPYAGVRLTRSGRKLALRILRRHRVIELFLVEVLGMDWAEVHEEAERLEHAVSERVLDCMDQYLGSPAFDPHGDPIPRADGSVGRRPLERLDRVPGGSHCRVARITDQSPSFLRAVERFGLRPGADFEVGTRDAEAGTLDVRFTARRRVTLADEVAGRVLVERRRR